MTNEQIASKFEMLADLLEFQGANPFRLRAYRNGARVIRDLPQSIESLVGEGADLTEFDGIGKGVAQKCEALVKTGTMVQLDELLEEVPRTVLDLLRIPKLGPKKAAIIFHELKIATLDDLKQACMDGKVRVLSGFGEKTENAILEGIDLAASANQRIYWSRADDLAEQLREHMDGCKAVRKLEFAGSYRRGKETVGDLDMLVVSKDADAVMDRFGEFPMIESVSGRGPTKMSVRLDSGFQIDLRVVPAESFGAALQYFTGSKDHNVQLRGLAKQRGLKINEWGVFEVKGKKETYVAGKTEKEVYAALDLPLFPPERREARGEFEIAEQGRLPKLIELKDLRGDLHMHTTETDGKATLQEMVAAARERGLSYIAITDHSKRVSMARGLDSKRLRQQWKAIDKLNQTMGDEFVVLKGIECDILEAGGMDLPDDVLAEADWVLASVHYGQDQPREQITDRILGALEHPHVTAIAHPTGRLINRRKAYAVDMDAIFQSAVANHKILELNANPARLDLHENHCAVAKSLGIPIVINSDAHSCQGLDVLQYGIKQARRGGLTKKDVVNTLDLGKLLATLKKS